MLKVDQDIEVRTKDGDSIILTVKSGYVRCGDDHQTVAAELRKKYGKNVFSKIYGYPCGDGYWPVYQDGDMGAALRAIEFFESKGEFKVLNWRYGVKPDIIEIIKNA